MSDVVKPLIRWVGGKTRLLKHFDAIIGTRAIRNYHEPMVGGGAAFFHYYPLAEHCYLNDVNIPLIETYNQVKSNPELLIAHIKRLHESGQSYDSMRADFNQKQPLLGLVKRSALFLALNHLCFNGLYRENRAGEFNTPIGGTSSGDRTLATFPYESINEAHKALRRAVLSATPIEMLLEHNFTKLKTQLGEGDVVILDPPYLGTFSDYNARGFGLTSHTALRDYAQLCESKGALCIVCGSNTEQSLEIYGKPREVVQLKRTVGASNRGVAEECIWVFGK